MTNSPQTRTFRKLNLIDQCESGRVCCSRPVNHETDLSVIDSHSRPSRYEAHLPAIDSRMFTATDDEMHGPGTNGPIGVAEMALEVIRPGMPVAERRFDQKLRRPPMRDDVLDTCICYVGMAHAQPTSRKNGAIDYNHSLFSWRAKDHQTPS